MSETNVELNDDQAATHSGPSGPPAPIGVDFFKARLAAENEVEPEAVAELDAAAVDDGEGQSDLLDDEGPGEVEAEAAADDTGEPEPEVVEEAREFEVIVDGETRLVSEDEVRQGYMRTADYTRKTQEVAEQRREVAQSAERMANLPKLYELVAQNMMKGFDQVNWQQLTPEQHQQLTVAKQTRAQEAAELAAVAKGFDEQIQKVTQQKREQEVSRAREILPQAIPNWGDDVYAETMRYAVDELGYSQEEATNTTDYRQILAWNKAMTLDSSSRRVQDTIATGKATETKRPGKQPRPAQQAREPRADGRLRAAQARLAKSPGSRKAKVDFFTEKLAHEKARKGR